MPRLPTLIALAHGLGGLIASSSRRGLLSALASFLGMAAVALAATPPNSVVSNTAGASYSIGMNNVSVSATASVTTAACVDSGLKVELMQTLSPAAATQAPAGAGVEVVQRTGYAPGGTLNGPFTTLGNPTLLGDAQPTPLPASLFLAPMSDAAGRAVAAFGRNEPIFIRVTSYDSNLNPAVADQVEVSLATLQGGDSEVLQLTETGPSTGVFIGVVQSLFVAAGTPTLPNDGKISMATHNESITVSYKHLNCASGANIASFNSGLIDPYGIVFDSKSGRAVDGARLSLLSSPSNLPATVYCDDNVTVLPQPVTSGAPTLCDAVMSAGSYRFPHAAAGNYHLLVIPPTDHVFASTLAAADLPLLIGTPLVAPVILGAPGLNPGGSYGGVFSLRGPAVRVDVPLDPAGTTLTLQKIAAKSVVGTGEFVPYLLSVSNNSAAIPVVGAVIADHLPTGFRYQKGSTRLNGIAVADPLIAADGTTLSFTLNIAPAAVATLHYVLEVTPAAHTGMAENTAVASGGMASNTAHASVLVREDLFRNKAILMGRVIDGACDDKDDLGAKGLQNARIVLQDGSYVLTDKEGRWHMDNLRPGTHVVQLDGDSLPKEYAVVACEPNSRNAGRNYSQFVNLRGGSLWRADFHVQKSTVAINTESPSLPAAPVAAVEDEAGRLLESLPYDAAWLAAAAPGDAWLHPQESFHPNLPVMKLAVKHDPRHTLHWRVNGEAVSPLLFEGSQKNAAGSLALSIWSAVPVQEGNNQVELLVRDGAGQEISRSQRRIYYAAAPDRVESVPQRSRLIADGKNRPLIALRFLDKTGVPVRRGLTGEFQLNEPYRSWVRHTGLEQEPLNGSIGAKARFEIKDDGLAFIELEPTTQSGEAVLGFQFNDQGKQEVRAWLEAGQRDWILVGFGEGTLGHKTLSGNLEALRAAEADKELFDGNKLAFYAKGSIRGDSLLTLAYDTSKQAVLKQAVDPTQYYTLYADASQARFDAASTSRLYIKLERKQFYAMFGDFDTGLTVTELSRYNRSLTGVKSEYKGETLGYNAFATLTDQAYVKDEIPGNGTSGLYKLSRGNLVINSDKLRIESRDRFQSQNILRTRNLIRYLDYDIDYALGNLSFHEPILTRDSNFNPNIIIIEYESADARDKAASFGGRASFKPNKATEIGASLIHEGTVGAKGDLHALDASVQLDANTRLRGEVAVSKRTTAGVDASGNAWLAEIQHREASWDAKAYARESSAGFGLGQQAVSEIGQRKMGLDGQLKLSDTLRLQGQAWRQENLLTNATTALLEGRLEQKWSENLNAWYGARAAQDKNADATLQSKQIIAGAAYTLLDKKLALHGSAEVGSGTAASVNAPDRLLLGADYKLTEKTKAFAEQEFLRGAGLSASSTRLGLRTQPWSGGEASASLGNSRSLDGERVYANLGLVQRWQINKEWQADLSLDRSQSLHSSATSPSPSTPLPFASITGDYTAAAVGLAYHNAIWSGNARVEIRNAGSDQQKNLQFGLSRKLDGGRSLAAGFTLRDVRGVGMSLRSSDLRVSYAHRPNDSRWVWFNRSDYITQSSQAQDSMLKGAKFVNNFNANYMPNRRTQISLQYGAKYVVDVIDGTDYKGYTDLMGVEIRHDLSPDWDIGAFVSRMRSLNSGVRDYGMGVSIGFKLMDNAWLSLGYNLRGMSDGDFSAASYRASGVHLTLRIKADQDSLGLNKRSDSKPFMAAGE